MKTTQPLLDYLATCSQSSLQSFELARLNDVSNLRQQLFEKIMATVEEMIEADIQARLAHWVQGRRRPSRRSSQRVRHSREIREAQFALPLPAAAGNPPEFPPLRTNGVLRLATPVGSPISSPSPQRPKLTTAG
jgi:hypothetical protein